MASRRRDRERSYSSDEEFGDRNRRKRTEDYRKSGGNRRSTERDFAHVRNERRRNHSSSPERRHDYMRSEKRRSDSFSPERRPRRENSRERNGQRRHRSRSPRSDRRDECRRSRDDLRQARNRRDEGRDQSSTKRRRSPSSSRSPSRSPPRRRSKRSKSPRPVQRSKVPLPSQNDAFKGTSTALAVKDSENPKPVSEKQKPNFAPSGKLAAETNTVAGTGIILKYNEPPEARKAPASQAWRLYVFKGKETLDTLELFTRSCWLLGRERSVVDYAIEHPSCSKQHAVLQFRFVEKKNEFGDRIGRVKPYVIDLESANGTRLNGDLIPERRFVEVQSGDVLVFGESTREYVLMLPPAE